MPRSHSVLLAFILGIGVAAPVAAQAPGIPADASIRLQRTSCHGPCPVYTITIDARGEVTYEGERFVRIVGRDSARINPSAVAALLQKATDIGFFTLRDQYRHIVNKDGEAITVSDRPTTFVTITVNGRTKRVEDYVAAPEALGELERDIDQAAGSARWVSP